MSNPTHPKVYKIGYTEDLERRRKQLSAAPGVIMEYKIEWSFQCFNGRKLETEVHARLSEYRIRTGREHFQVDIVKAKKVIEELGENYK